VNARAALCPRVAVFAGYGKQTVKTCGLLATVAAIAASVWPLNHIAGAPRAARLWSDFAEGVTQPKEESRAYL